MGFEARVYEQLKQPLLRSSLRTALTDQFRLLLTLRLRKRKASGELRNLAGSDDDWITTVLRNAENWVAHPAGGKKHSLSEEASWWLDDTQKASAGDPQVSGRLRPLAFTGIRRTPADLRHSR